LHRNKIEGLLGHAAWAMPPEPERPKGPGQELRPPGNGISL